MKKRTFNIENFEIIDSETSFALENFSAIKRRLSLLDKAVISSIEKIFHNDVKEIIFSSQYGELDKLDKIIDEYIEFNEVSPAKFSGSVHNFPVGCYTFIKKLNIPYSAVSSGENSVSLGLLQAILSKNDKVIFCYCDCIENKIECVSLLISKKDDESYELNTNKDIKNKNEYLSLCEFLKGNKKEFITQFFTIKRLEK